MYSFPNIALVGTCEYIAIFWYNVLKLLYIVHLEYIVLKLWIRFTQIGIHCTQLWIHCTQHWIHCNQLWILCTQILICCTQIWIHFTQIWIHYTQIRIQCTQNKLNLEYIVLILEYDVLKVHLNWNRLYSLAFATLIHFDTLILFYTFWPFSML